VSLNLNAAATEIGDDLVDAEFIDNA